MKITAITSADAYKDLRFRAILALEERGDPHLTPYNDGAIGVNNGYVTIGIGFNLHDAMVRQIVLSKLGFTGSELNRELSVYLGIAHAKDNLTIQSELNNIVQKYLPGRSFSFNSVMTCWSVAKATTRSMAVRVMTPISFKPAKTGRALTALSIAMAKAALSSWTRTATH